MKHISAKAAVFAVMLCLPLIGSAQKKYLTRTGKAHFLSQATMENIEAVSNQANIIIDTKDGNVGVKVPIRSFDFEKALMEEHFNENYMESEKYPQATFSGKIVNPSAVKWDTDGTYNVDVEGKMTIHGVTKDVKEKATITVKGGQLLVKTTMKVTLEDYKIKNDRLNNIAKVIDVTLEGTLEEYTR